MIHVDTNVLYVLYGGEGQRIPRSARRLLDQESIAFSPMVELELAYLYEIGRARAPALQVIEQLGPALGLQVSTAPFAAVVREATRLTWTRDPFDRIIAAQAVVDGATLLTADTDMLEHLPGACWE